MMFVFIFGSTFSCGRLGPTTNIQPLCGHFLQAFVVDGLTKSTVFIPYVIRVSTWNEYLWKIIDRSDLYKTWDEDKETCFRRFGKIIFLSNLEFNWKVFYKQNKKPIVKLKTAKHIGAYMPTCLDDIRTSHWRFTWNRFTKKISHRVCWK